VDSQRFVRARHDTTEVPSLISCEERLDLGSSKPAATASWSWLKRWP